MKFKDINLGEEYLIGAPNARGTYGCVRGRVTGVGVFGLVKDSIWKSCSARANYVEFQLLDKETGEPVSGETWDSSYGGWVDTDDNKPLCRRIGGEMIATGDKVYRFRAPASHIQRTWVEHLDLIESRKCDAHREKIEKDAREVKRRQVMAELKRLGLESEARWDRWDDGGMTISLADAEGLAERLRRLLASGEQDTECKADLTRALFYRNEKVKELEEQLDKLTRAHADLLRRYATQESILTDYQDREYRTD